MRKTSPNLQGTENRANLVVDTMISPCYRSSVIMKKKKQGAFGKTATLVRFDSEEQKKKLTEVAEKRRQSLNQFLLTAAEELARQTMEKAS